MVDDFGSQETQSAPATVMTLNAKQVYRLKGTRDDAAAVRIYRPFEYISPPSSLHATTMRVAVQARCDPSFLNDRGCTTFSPPTVQIDGSPFAELT